MSAPIGARTVSLFLRESEYQKVYAIGMDYAWGRNSVQVFESEMKRANKDSKAEARATILLPIPDFAEGRRPDVSPELALRAC
jgi:hypothetical protein